MTNKDLAKSLVEGNPGVTEFIYSALRDGINPDDVVTKVEDQFGMSSQSASVAVENALAILKAAPGGAARYGRLSTQTDVKPFVEQDR